MTIDKGRDGTLDVPPGIASSCIDGPLSGMCWRSIRFASMASKRSVPDSRARGCQSMARSSIRSQVPRWSSNLISVKRGRSKMDPLVGQAVTRWAWLVSRRKDRTADRHLLHGKTSEVD